MTTHSIDRAIDRAIFRAGRRCGVAAACVVGALGLSILPAAAVPTAVANPALVPAQASRQAPPQSMGPPSEADIEQSIDALRQHLRLSPAQEPAFHAVAQAMRAHARDMRQLPQPPRNARLSVVEGMRFELRYMEAQTKGLRRLLPALETLYARLSPSQRQQLDAFFRPQRQQ